ncbi:MAG: Hsp70 family protein [Bryobacteraceae bacterium]|nr:Hsp70 family protein [Bryobacteraceae bacterium]
MKLGIDFGTTRIVVAAADRGNYPVVSFDAGDETRDWYPPTIAFGPKTIHYGWDALGHQGDPAWTLVRSLKRELHGAGPHSEIDAAGQPVRLLDVLTGLAKSLAAALRERSNAGLKPGEPLEAMLGVPANANSNQRYLTTEAFRRGGFHVLGMLNEPSAASVEFAHRHRQGKTSAAEETLLVYDLGGGTFDASILRTGEKENVVVATAGLPHFGGDDFDEMIAEFALDEDRRQLLTAAENYRFLEECRERKESIKPTTKRVSVDLESVRPGWGGVNVTVAQFESVARPRIERSIEVVEGLVKALGPAGSIDALYVTGGGSELPLVSRMLRESFGRSVKRSTYTRAATAIGLAIHADEQPGAVVRERFGRAFGVWREADHGRRAWLDVIFERGTVLPLAKQPALVRERRYYPVHNIGHFRYLEAADVTRDGEPAGDLAFWDEIYFPFDPALAKVSDLANTPVTYSEIAQGQEIHERFICDASGAVHVELSNATAGYVREFALARWATGQVTIKPGVKRRRKENA